jgi:hypothetical protein
VVTGATGTLPSATGVATGGLIGVGWWATGGATGGCGSGSTSTGGGGITGAGGGRKLIVGIGLSRWIAWKNAGPEGLVAIMITARLSAMAALMAAMRAGSGWVR